MKYFELRIEAIPDENVPPMKKLNDLLHSFEEKLPPYTFWHGEKAPLFIVDEANELRALTKDKVLMHMRDTYIFKHHSPYSTKHSRGITFMVSYRSAYKAILQEALILQLHQELVLASKAFADKHS